MEKIVRDGKVAVAVSYGYGAGWSTWEEVNPMDARFNQLFLDGNIDEIKRICEEEEMYAGGAEKGNRIRRALHPRRWQLS